MFHKTRLKLTAWYLLIIMVISISFSVVIYRVLSSELDRVERMQRSRLEHQFPGFFSPDLGNGQLPPNFRFMDPEIVSETQNRLLLSLTLINILILSTSAIGGYFLAGRTLKPISNMLEEQKRFIADASHEIRTPLTSLKTEIEVNLRNKNLNLKDTRVLLNSNLEEVNNLQSLSDNLIRLTQYQTANNNFSLENLSLNSVINTALKKVSKLALAKNISFNNEIADNTIKGQEVSLVELFVIILDNAIKYSPQNSSITIKSHKNDGFIDITIIDQGIGIAKEDLPHLFERFYRSDKSRTKEKIAGYGLGLSIAKEIVEKHHGSIKVKSEINKGTTFTIELPHN